MDRLNNEKVDLSLENEEFLNRYGRKKIIATFTLGCKVNQYESEAITELFDKYGYQTVDFEEYADVYVINTCTVTGLSDRKSRQVIRKAGKQNENAIIAVIGCYAQTAPGEVSRIEGVNIVLGTRDRLRLPELVEQAAREQVQIVEIHDISKKYDFEELPLEKMKGRTRAYLKIQEGCNNYCSYCIIPYARGPVRSRRQEDTVNEVERLVAAGFKEVVLTGIHVASYGKDINSGLIDIIKKIHDVQGIERIRISSVEPGTITARFAAEAARLPKLCPHYHLSLQSGCDETLARMNRIYTTAQYREVVERLRSNIDDVAVTTDVIVGFPGETDEEFDKTYEFCKSIGFAKMHIFKFSPRKGTRAAGFSDQISPGLKEERSKKMLALSDCMQNNYNKSFVDRTLMVLVEQGVDRQQGLMEGLTPNYIKVALPGIDKAGISVKKGDICAVKIIKAETDYVQGNVVKTKI